MDELKEIMNIDWPYVFIALCIFLSGVKAFWSLADWFLFEKLKITTKKMEERRQESELLKETAKNLKELREKHTEDESNLRQTLTEFIEETKNIIKAQDENNRKHWETSKKIRNELTGTIKVLEESNQNKDSQINNLIIANREMLADRINQKYKYYISIDGIPEDEYDEFVSMHKAYNGVGGNSHGDAKFEYCKEHLPIIPVETKLSIKHHDR